MNGATTEPFARISRPPSVTIMMTMGSSQSFFLALRNTHSSLINDILDTSELVFVRIRLRSDRVSCDPERVGDPLAQPELVASRQSRDDGNGGDHQEKYRAHDDGANDEPEQESEHEPRPVERSEQPGAGQCDD